MTHRFLPAALLALGAALLPSSAHAQAASSPAGRGHVQLIKPLSVTRLDDLDFGTVTVTGAGAGTITIDPNEDGAAAIASTGPLQVGSDPHAARFGGAAIKKTVVIIRVPKKDVLMTRQGGTEQMRISDFTIEGKDKKTLAAMESFDFRVGGTLHVEDGQAEGLYEGKFDVEIQYP